MQSDSPTPQPAPKAELSQLINQLIASRQITLRQYQDLAAAVMADGNVDELERREINRLFDAIQLGAVKFVG
ncbi:MAG TPA: hypothetical protein V6D06_21080 [Trichocoleus sp.]